MKSPPKKYTRRNFLSTMTVTSAGLLAGCLAPKGSLSDRGTSPGPVRLAFVTDIHAHIRWGVPKALQRAATAINDQHSDLVIMGGDLITGGFRNDTATLQTRWDAYLNFKDRLKAEVHHVIGNHDLTGVNPKKGRSTSPDPRAAFRAATGADRTYSSFELMGCHFILLDSVAIDKDGTSYQGRVNSEQLAWLREDLAQTHSSTPIVMTSHIPLRTAFFQATMAATASAPPTHIVTNSMEVLELFRNYNLVLVLQGHLHVAELLRWRNTTFITGGAICADWWRGPYHGYGEGFCRVTLTENKVQWEYVEYGWRAQRRA